MPAEDRSQFDLMRQLLICSWVLGSVFWYVREFSPALAPIFHSLLRHLWH